MKITISDDKALLDITSIHRFLSEESTWAVGISRATVDKAIRNSLCLGAYENDRQVGFARVVTDSATYGYLSDVFTIGSHRGRGISRMLVEAILAHPDLQGLRRFTLVSTTASGLYEKFGWTGLHRPDSYMERYFPTIYHPTV